MDIDRGMEGKISLLCDNDVSNNMSTYHGILNERFQFYYGCFPKVFQV